VVLNRHDQRLRFVTVEAADPSLPIGESSSAWYRAIEAWIAHFLDLYAAPSLRGTVLKVNEKLFACPGKT
jgi:hypothetical protein